MSEQVGYVRVSSVGQNTDRQLEGVKLDTIYIDKVSGATKDRPELIACMNYMRKGDTLHIHSLDRLARSLRDLQELLDALVSKGVTVVSHYERLTFDSNDNPMSTLTMQLLGAFAQFERSISKKRQREGIDNAKKKGKHLGRPAIDQSTIERVRDMHLDRISIADIARKVNLSRASIYNILRQSNDTNI